MRLTVILAMTACIGTYAAPCLAGAWTQKQGEGLAIFNLWYYSTDSYFNNTGHETAQPDYRKYEINPYFEYGLYDKVTLGANLSLQSARQDISTGGETSSWGVGDSEFFARVRLWDKNGLVVSAEPLVKLPSPAPDDLQPVIGSDHPDLGMGFSLGYGFSAYGQHHFLNLDAGYRYRFGSPENQMRYAGTLGIGLSEHWMLMPQLFLTYRAHAPATATYTQSSGDDYNLTKLQLSAVYEMTPDASVQFGGFGHLDGKNTGAGGGALMSLWKRF